MGGREMAPQPGHPHGVADAGRLSHVMSPLQGVQVEPPAGVRGLTPAVLNVLVILLIAGSATLVWLLPRSVLAFMAFQASLLVVYLVPLPARAKLGYGLLTLGVLMPVLGAHNAYYM